MFSKIQQHHHLFQPSRECQTSEEDDSPSSGGPTPITAQKPISGGSSGDGATIEAIRRPRGRPPGSKNKPKSPLVITQEPEPAMSAHILEVPGGSDVVESIARFSRRRNTGLIVLTSSGTVTNVTLRQPSAPHGAVIIFHGRFEILSISATFIPHPPETSPPVPNGFSISLAGPQGQIVGGLVVGKLLAAGTVYVIAASFNNPSYHRLPLEEDVRNNSFSFSGGGDVQSPPVSGAESGHVPAESCMYSSQFTSDVIWAPADRPPF